MTLITNPVRNGRLWTAAIALMWIIIGAVASFPEDLGNIEGRLMPVARDYRITSMTENPDGATAIRGELYKSRRCSFRFVEFSLKGEGGLNSAVPLINGGIQRLNPIGPMPTGPWMIYAPKEDILTRGVGVMVHRCHPLFLTRTTIYQGDLVR